MRCAKLLCGELIISKSSEVALPNISGWGRFNASYGADVYVPGDFIEDKTHGAQSSSHATRIVTELIRNMVKIRGPKSSEYFGRVKKFLSGVTVSRKVGEQNGWFYYKALDFQKVLDEKEE